MNFKKCLQFNKLIQEVQTGKRGFISITNVARDLGVDKKELVAVVKKHNLSVNNHGRYGCCASKQ